MSADASTEVVVAAVLDEEPEDTAPEVFLTVRQHERDDYARAAHASTASGVDVVLVEHEYGIFGGDFGEYLVDLVEALSVPYVVTLHTLLREPGPQQRAVLRRVIEGRLAGDRLHGDGARPARPQRTRARGTASRW